VYTAASQQSKLAELQNTVALPLSVQLLSAGNGMYAGAPAVLCNHVCCTLLLLQVKVKGARRITWPEFVKALDHIAAKKVRQQHQNSSGLAACALTYLTRNPWQLHHGCASGSSFACRNNRQRCDLLLFDT
jgi:hypothetical protein